MTNYNEELHKLINIDSTPEIRITDLLMEGADPNYALHVDITHTKEKGTYPILIKAIIRRNLAAVEALIKGGASLDTNFTIQEKDGNAISISPLDMARKVNKSNPNDASRKILMRIWEYVSLKNQQTIPMAA